MDVRQFGACVRHASWLKLLTSSALLAGLLTSVIHVTVAYADWRGAQIEWARYVTSGTAARCEAIARACDEESTAKAKSGKDDESLRADSRRDSFPREADPYAEFVDIRRCTEQRERQEHLRGEQWGQQYANCGKSKPLQFSASLTSSDHINHGKAVEAALAIWGALMAGIVLFRLFGAETNLGWRRLAVLASAAGAGAGAFYAAEESMGDAQGISMTLAAAAAAFATVLIGRRLFLWVSEGFKDVGPHPS
jgi:hypothetical protein